MSQIETPKPGDILTEHSKLADFYAQYIVLSVNEQNLRVYPLYVESPYSVDMDEQGVVTDIPLYEFYEQDKSVKWTILS